MSKNIANINCDAFHSEMLILFFQIVQNFSIALFQLRFDEGGPLLAKHFSKQTNRSDQNIEKIENVDPREKRFEVFATQILQFYHKTTQFMISYEKEMNSGCFQSSQDFVFEPNARNISQFAHNHSEQTRSGFFKKVKYFFDEIDVVEVVRDNTDLHILLKIDDIRVQFSCDFTNFYLPGFIPQFFIHLPIKQEIFDLLILIDEYSNQRVLDHAISLFTQTYDLMKTVVRLLRFLDSSDFYVKFTLQAIIKNNLHVSDNDKYWEKFKQLPAVQNALFFLADMNCYHHCLAPVFHETLWRVQFCTKFIVPEKKNSKLLQNNGEIKMKDEHFCLIFGDFLDLVKRRLVTNVYLDHRTLENMKKSIYPQIKTIWLEERNILEDPVLFLVFPFLETIFIKNEQISQNERLNIFIRRDFPFEVESTREGSLKHLLITNYPFNMNLRHAKLTISNLEITNSFLIDLQKVVQNNCQIRFNHCHMENCNFIDQICANDDQNKIYWADVVYAWSNTYIKSILCYHCHLSIDFKEIWSSSIITKDIKFEKCTLLRSL